jgi:hypothetical protein
MFNDPAGIAPAVFNNTHSKFPLRHEVLLAVRNQLNVMHYQVRAGGSCPDETIQVSLLGLFLCSKLSQQKNRKNYSMHPAAI